MFEVEALSASYGLHRALDRVSLRVGERALPLAWRMKKTPKVDHSPVTMMPPR